MANPTVTNKASTFQNDTNADIPVRSVDSVAVSGKQVQVITSGFSIPDYDYIAVAYPTTTTETFTYKTGGASGTTIATVTITYTDTTKVNISSVAKT